MRRKRKNPSKRRGAAKWRLAEKRFAFSPDHYDFEWTKDGKYFRAKKRDWTDFPGDQSYAKHQGRNNPRRRYRRNVKLWRASQVAKHLRRGGHGRLRAAIKRLKKSRRSWTLFPVKIRTRRSRRSRR